VTDSYQGVSQAVHLKEHLLYHLSHQHAGHSQTPVAQYGAQLGPGEHFECHAHPLGDLVQQHMDLP